MHHKDRSLFYEYANGDSFKGKSIEKVFTNIAKNNTWDSSESISGIGSSLEQTTEITRQLPSIFKQFKIQSILDAPCGDFHWMQQVDLSNISYTGGDIVKAIISQNQKQFSTAFINFVQLDLTSTPLDSYDLIFCRDCLVHLSFLHIKQVLRNIKQSQSTWLMTTTFPNHKTNKDITTGGWRLLNFEAPPFNFPKPIYLLNEKCSEMNGIFQDKSLALWNIKTQINDTF